SQVATPGKNAMDQTSAGPTIIRNTARALRSIIDTAPLTAAAAINAPSGDIASATMGAGPIRTSPVSLVPLLRKRTFPSALPAAISPSAATATAFKGDASVMISGEPSGNGQIRSVRS